VSGAPAPPAPDVLQPAKTQRWTPEDLLRTLVEAEIAAREAPNARARLKAATFPTRKTLEEFDLVTSPVKRQSFDQAVRAARGGGSCSRRRLSRPVRSWSASARRRPYGRPMAWWPSSAKPMRAFAHTGRIGRHATALEALSRTRCATRSK